MVEMSVLVLRRSALIALLAGLAFGADPANITELQRGFQHPPDDARMMVRWWWFGPAVTKPELEREMRLMKQGGIGGFEVQPTYALELDNPAKGIKNLPYMSPEFLEALTLHRREGQGTRPADGSHAGQRLALRRTAHSRWNCASPRLRVARTAVTAGAAAINAPELQPGEKLIAAFMGSQELEPAGSQSFRLPPSATGQATFFISSHTRQTVKRPAVGAEGWVLNHYDHGGYPAAFQERSASPCSTRWPRRRRTRSSATAWKSTTRIGPAISSRNSPEAPRLRPDALPARAGRRHRRQDRRHPPRLGTDPQRTRR